MPSTEPPLYENILYDSQHQGSNQSSLGVEDEDIDQATHHLKSGPGSSGRSDSLSSVFLPGPLTTRDVRVGTAAGGRENVTTRNRSVEAYEENIIMI